MYSIAKKQRTQTNSHAYVQAARFELSDSDEILITQKQLQTVSKTIVAEIVSTF